MKRIFSLALSVALILCAALPTAGAAVRNRIVDHITTDAFSNYEQNAAINPEGTVAADEITIPLVPQGFRDENSAIINWEDPDAVDPLGPTVDQVRSNFIIAKIMIAKGKDVIRDIDIVRYTPTRRVRARSAIRIRFVEDLLSAKEIEYEFRVCLVLDNAYTYVEENFGGMISNPITEVDGNDDYVDLAKGMIASCVGSNSNIEADLGSGVSAFLNMAAGEKYYGIAKYEDNDGQTAILKAYKQIDGVYTLKTINLQSSLSYVKLKVPSGSEYSVYNQLGKYIGQSGDELPYATKYYLSGERIDIVIDEADLKDDIVLEKPMGAALARFSKQAENLE